MNHHNSRSGGRTERSVGSRWALVLLAGTLLIGPPAKAITVRLQTEAGVKPSQLELLALRPDGSAIKAPLAASDLRAGQLTLSWPKSAAALTCEGAAIWCPVVGVAKPAPPEVTLAVWPGGTASAKIEAPQGTAVPAKILVEGSPLAASHPEVKRTLLVPAKGKLTFPLPAVPLDLRFAADGRMPVYRRGVRLSAGKKRDLGTLRFAPGASAVGWVVDQESGLPVGKAKLTLAPMGAPSLPPGLRPPATQSSTSGPRGFFQLRGVPPGRYTLEVQAPDHAPHAFGPFEVLADSEARLGNLEVPPYLSLSISVSPPLDPHGGHWSVEAQPDPGTSGRTRRATMDGNGQGTLGQVAPGKYTVKVSSARGEPLLVEQKSFDHSGPLDLAVDLVRIEGTVTIGGDPLAASVKLSSGAMDSVELTSNEKGKFSGEMRRPKLAVLYAEVRARKPAVHRIVRLEVPAPEKNAYHLAIDLGDGAITGTVVDSDHNPVKGAFVQLGSAAAGYEPVPVQSATNGGFAFRGLDAGTYTLSASDDKQGESAPRQIVLGKDDERRETLVLGESETVSGEVLDASGAPVGGAEVWLASIANGDVTGASTSSAHAGPAGRFSARIAKGAANVAVTVFAPGQMLWSGCVAHAPGGPLVVHLPAGPPGTLLLTAARQSHGAGQRELFLASADGGGIPFRVLVQWIVDLNGKIPRAAGYVVSGLSVPEVAPGIYAPLTVPRQEPGPDMLLSAMLCNGGAPGADWKQLAPGGTLELQVPLPDPARDGSYPLSGP